MTEELRTEDFNYHLPDELIASRPTEKRDGSRMMVIDRKTGSISCHMFEEFIDFISEGDLCVLNNTKVVKSRFMSDDDKIEITRLDEPEPNLWKCLVKPGKKMRIGHSIIIDGVTGSVENILEDGERLIRFDNRIDIEKNGKLALPHYMRREAEDMDSDRYQTVYAEKPGAIAAPTAGLHFTNQHLSTIPHTFITLHVGVGTFRPVKADRITDHEMHSEFYEVSSEAAEKINAASRRISIGTTVTRVLEHISQSKDGMIKEESGETNIFIYPGYQFTCVDALLTNFHLPKSTLFMLVSALAGQNLMLEAYQKAVEERFRFFSYGDCCLIL